MLSHSNLKKMVTELTEEEKEKEKEEETKRNVSINRSVTKKLGRASSLLDHANEEDTKNAESNKKASPELDGLETERGLVDKEDCLTSS